MSDKKITFIAKVRSSYGTYIARSVGISASCTAGAIQAVEALVRKMFVSKENVKIEFIGKDIKGRDCYRVSLGGAQ